MFRPSDPFTIPMTLMTVTEVVSKYGVPTKTFTDGGHFYGSFKTFGGTEKVVDGVYSVEDTAVIVTWYRPEIKANSRIIVNGVPYEVLGTPEDIDLRHQFLKFKVRAIEGGA